MPSKENSMSSIRIAVIGSVLTLALASVGPAMAADATGLWSTDGGQAKVRVAPCGGELCGTIVALAQPNDPATGRPMTDKHNDDAARRSRPLIGTRILLGMKPDGAGKWVGRIYDAKNGKTVSGSITLSGASALKLEGCALGGMICRSQTWTRAN
jgi:uncharacterized protein (DUF2147 family)